MKTRLLFLMALLSVACSIIEIEEQPTSLQKEEIRETLRLKSADSLFYHAQTGLYITPNSNALSRLASSSESSSRVTHYAVKFYPKSREEQHYLNNLEGITMSYIPFGYDAVKTENYRLADLQNVPIFAESNAHTVTISGEFEVDSVDGGTVCTSNESVTLHLPVMYAIWPTDVPLPANVEHSIVYRKVDPDLEIDPFINLIRFPIKFQTYDSLLCTYVPLRNIKVMFSYNGHTSHSYTNNQGRATIFPEEVFAIGNEMAVEVYYELETPKWTISRSESTTPIIEYLGTTQDLWRLPLAPRLYTVTCHSFSNEFEIHRAVDYYHNSSHELSDSISTQEYGVIIHSYSRTNNEDPSLPAQTLAFDNFTIVYNLSCTQSERIATVCHELGHIRHYQKLPGMYYFIPSSIKESYASFVGWYLGWEYYWSKGFVQSYLAQEINWQGRQDWMPSSNWYTPMFVDLHDNYNQWIDCSSYLYDDISGVPIAQLDYIGSHCTSISQCASSLRYAAGAYYTLSQINNYLKYYQ